MDIVADFHVNVGVCARMKEQSKALVCKMPISIVPDFSDVIVEDVGICILGVLGGLDNATNLLGSHGGMKELHRRRPIGWVGLEASLVLSVHFAFHRHALRQSSNDCMCLQGKRDKC